MVSTASYAFSPLAWRLATQAEVFALNALFAALLLIPPLAVAAGHAQGLALFDAFYRSGALVFGGGHVVLPLLRDAVVTPGWVRRLSETRAPRAVQRRTLSKTSSKS